MHATLKWISLIGLLAAAPALAGERCEAARATFARVAAGYPCSSEIWSAGWVDCSKDIPGMRRFWDLTETCAQKLAQSPDRSGRLRAINEERAQVKGLLDPLVAERIPLGGIALGIVPAGVGAVTLLGGLLYGVSFSLFGGNTPAPWTDLRIGLVIGGAIGLFVGAIVILAVLVVRQPYNERISPLQDRLRDLDEAKDQETTDAARLLELRGASSELPALPFHVAFTVARF